MDSGESIQDRFLGVLRDKRSPVSIFLKNGIKLQGTIENFDQYSVLLKNGTSQMVYKRAISTIMPSGGERTRRDNTRKQ